MSASANRTVPPIWQQLACDEDRAASLAAELNVDPIVARLLCLRGVTGLEEAARFLRPSMEHLHDPALMTDLGRSVDRVLAAIAGRERVAVHGDYDVDGVTSTVMLRRALEMLGGDVIHFIPDRVRDGYGLQPAAVERLHADGAAVVITVDCGIRGADAARRARDLGIDLIVTDHHEPDAALPPAFSVINPRRPDCPYPEKNLAGVGVAFKLVQALCLRAGRPQWLPGFLKMAAIGTLADVVPLVGENRVIAKLGLERLSCGPHTVGLQALLDSAGLSGKAIDSYHVAFILAPRLNAAGRMSTPDLATRLLLASDEDMAPEARALAEQLNAENLRRQQEEAEILARARRLVESDPDVGARTVLVVAGESWHRGVIGIVASKLVDVFYRPAIVLSIEDGVAHGSCRSIPAFDMLGALERCGDLFMRFGGHRQAAGLAMDAAHVEALRRRINEHADSVLVPDDLRPRLLIDAACRFREVSEALVGQLSALAPFGVGNRRPVFRAGPVALADGPRRLKDRHLSMSLRQDGRVFRAVAWRAAEREAFFASNGQALDVAFTLERNEYRGETFVELFLTDAKPAGQ